MKVTIELPNDFVSLAFTAIAAETRLLNTAVKTFTTCCNITDGLEIRVCEADKGYKAEVIQKDAEC